ncbi:hypothetical protein [Methylobacter marinus]|uniref:hypothetical protein n=1 Tax=Methylobacter marinus TaxID=34058 RepID=UPI00037ECB17|nr:hypothetical protein [Methylobacter marinus]
MKVGELVSFNSEFFFEGAVQLRWIDERPAQAQNAAEAFVFHGPRYHGASDAESEGIEGGYRLKDSASFVHDLLASLHAGLKGEETNPYYLVVAGYGSGKSHLALTTASLLGAPKADTSNKIVARIIDVDPEIGKAVQADLANLLKPVLVLTLDGMAGFHLGNALSRAVLTQLSRYGVDAGAIRALSPRFQSAEQFVERNFAFRADSFSRRLPGLSSEEICARLRDNDEIIYSEVDVIYSEANGSPIPVVGQESAQELINTLCEVYCGPDGSFSSVVILFDEFGRYLEYAAEKPLLAGDAALQQIFQGVQDNSTKIRFIGFIQYELKAYLKRFGSADLRQLQRYITRFDSAQKWYLSTNLETIFAHMIRKEQAELSRAWEETRADILYHDSWQRMSNALPEYKRFPVWSDSERFNRVIAQGCWPLHPLATWFLTRQRDVVQSRSALTFIKEMIERIAAESVVKDGRLRQISAAELILSSMLPELIAAEHETGSTVAETLQLLLEKFSAHLDEQQRLVLAGVAILEKMRIGRQSQDNMDRLLCEATALNLENLSQAQQTLSKELGAIEWNRDLGQYELIADASTRGQFQQWLRKQQGKLTADAIRELFIRQGAATAELVDIATDFGLQNEISTQDWRFESQFAHSQVLEKVISRIFQEWEQAVSPTDAKGKVIYVYINSDEDIAQIERLIEDKFSVELNRMRMSLAPIWVIGIADQEGRLAEHIGRLYLFDEQMTVEEREHFRRFVPEEMERSRQALKEYSQESIKQRLFWIAGFQDIPAGRLKQVGNEIFSQVYPHALPFPFDGFATSAGGGAADCAQLTRSLISRHVDGHWVQAQPKRLQNRVNSLLFCSWKALLPSGKLTSPVEPKVKAVFDRLEQNHKDNPKRTLWDSFKELIAPPYGMNAASAELLLGLMLGGIAPPRRIERRGEMVSSGDWLSEAFPKQQGKHYLDKSLLQNSILKFLSEDSEGRWRNLLNRWETEPNYQLILELANEAAQTNKVAPIPEVLEGIYLHLKDRANQIALKIKEIQNELDECELKIEKAEKNNAVGELLRVGTQLIKTRQRMEDEDCWPRQFIESCDAMLSMVQPILAGLIRDWLPRQSCNSTVQVSDFRYRMGKAIESLQLLGFKTEAKSLEQQVQHSIANVEARQRFSLTLDESDDYPRQPNPTESTPVRELRDEITKGDNLIKSLQGAHSVLSQDEINSRVKAIENRQNRLREMVKHQNKLLADLFSQSLNTETNLLDVLVKAKRLKGIFVGTPDEGEVSDIIFQLGKILDDVATWDSNNVSPDKLQVLLNLQIQQQLGELKIFLEAKEIESAWDLGTVYSALAKERIAAAIKRSSDWLLPRTQLLQKVDSLNIFECEATEKEFMAAPSYLSKDDRLKVDGYLDTLRMRHTILEEEIRSSKIKAWQKQFLELVNIDLLTKFETERLLAELNNPPEKLTYEEKKLIQPVELELIVHLDQLSMDEIISRIERLPLIMRQQLLSTLSEMLIA